MERCLASSFAERDIRGARPACKADFSAASLLTCATEDKCEAVLNRAHSAATVSSGHALWREEAGVAT
jgi:hypothetical protein